MCFIFELGQVVTVMATARTGAEYEGNRNEFLIIFFKPMSLPFIKIIFIATTNNGTCRLSAETACKTH